MPISLFLDDLRTPPGDRDWTVARSSAAAIRVLATGRVALVSFDHDLGGDDTAMRDVDWLDERIYTDPDFPMPAWRVHSANPVGVSRIRSAMTAMERRRRG